MRHEEKYTALFWLNANDENSLRLSFRAVAQQVLKYHPSTSLLTGVDLGDLDQVVYAVKAWLDLKKNTRWLMIYDNYDNPRIPGNADSSAVNIRQFLPGSNQGSIVITTRSAQVREGRRIHVQKLPSIQEGLEILSNTSGRKDIETDPDAIALVKELDGLPLALSTAGAYLEHVTTSFSDYLRLHKASWLKLQATSPPLASYEDRSLYTTWQITLDQIEQENAASAKLLKLWAYFDRQDLWFELLRHGSSTDEEWMQVLTEDELSFNNAIRLLCNYGLVDPESSFPGIYRSGGYSIHSCVHSWTIFVLNKEWDQSLARLALTCVASKIPCTNMENWWLLQRRLLQHAIRQENFIMEGKVNSEGLDWTLHTLGDLYKDQGNLAKAEAMYIRALQGKEEALGPKYTSTLKTVNNLGLLYFDQGKLAKAEAMYIRALQGKEEVLGPKHTSTLMTVNNLGLLYSDQDNTADAKAMYIRALQGREEVLGLKNTYTLQTVNNLGVLYRNQGKLADAEAMFKRALQGYEEALGSKHTSTLDTVNNLGILYSKQGKLAEAEAMSKRALQGREETLGLKHILTLDTVNNLGNLYKNQGKLAEAEAMYIRALQGYKDSLSPELLLSYLPALNTMFTFGDLFLQTGRKDMAREMYSQALYGYTTVQEPSSKWCRQLEDRLHTLEVESAE